MKVVCEINNILELNDSSVVDRIKKYIHLSDGQLNFEKNKEYCVYGIVFRENSPWYYLCLDEDDESPTAYPAELFKTTDGCLSSHWRLSVQESSLVFDKWASDSSFYERLVEEDPSAIEQFKSYRSLMDKE
ncbi:hypothetical protein [Alkalimarinus alittae]|uniref:Uncharacterized protein n=1 Tax=Alkalimarinus alittae TaxID=2961619 RepID=A0ABY6N3I6_9ALTE|nr:hypothetical protein [Alkalimarinus alittae]UZE96644.1 hypothetical protein NKI27_02510 [Alkalimarinus alittae]